MVGTGSSKTDEALEAALRFFNFINSYEGMWLLMYGEQWWDFTAI